MIIKRDSFSFCSSAKIAPASMYPAGPLVRPDDEIHSLLLEATQGYTLLSRGIWKLFPYGIKRYYVRKLILEHSYLLDIVAYGPGDMRQSMGSDIILYVTDAKGYEGWQFNFRIFDTAQKWISGVGITIKNKGI